MRWYFAIDEAGSMSLTGEYAQMAVRSAINVGGLEPHLLYFGKENNFTRWMIRHDVKIIQNEPTFIDTINEAIATGIHKSHTIGHWLRVSIPLVENEEEFVLYTDCDVIFLKNVDWQVFRPRTFCAAPEFKKNNWNYFNSGVMIFNMPFMRHTYVAFEKHIRARISDPNILHYDDQIALNEVYKGYWERLNPLLNWKPYWGSNSNAAILHFHGPKLDVIEAIASGTWTSENPDQRQLQSLVDGHLDSYCGWLERLGDSMQMNDFPLSLRMHRASSLLLKRKWSLGDESVDLSLLDYCMFN